MGFRRIIPPGRGRPPLLPLWSGRLAPIGTVKMSDLRVRLNRAGLATAMLACVGLILSSATVRAQVAISSIYTTYTAGTASQVTLDGSTVTSDNSTLGVNSIVAANGTTYQAGTIANSVVFRTNTSDGPNNITQWYMGNYAASGNAPSTLYGPYDSGSASSVLGSQSNDLLRGTYRLFNDTYSDVQRMDVTFNSGAGFTAQSTTAFAIMDRAAGANFDIALITGVDSNGNPTSYGGNLVSVTSSDFGNGLLNSSNTPAGLLNNNGSGGSGTADPTTYQLTYNTESGSSAMSGSNITSDTTTSSSNISGVILNLSDFGISPGTTIYGYSIMNADVNDEGNINNLVDYSNSTYFPADDNDGISLTDASAMVFTEEPIPEAPAYGAVFLGLGFAGLAVRRLRRPRPAMAQA